VPGSVGARRSRDNGIASGRLFRRRGSSAEVAPGTDLSWLLSTTSRFDAPDS
jgi:hypothetical protein